MRVVPIKRTEVKARLIAECSKCKGSGCISCDKKCQVIDDFADANIPVAYWFLKLSSFTGPPIVRTTTQEYIKNLDSNFKSGLGICYTGSYGVGKTTSACAILKHAIINRRTAYYTTLTDLISYLTNWETQSEFYRLVTQADFLCIDEVDSRHFSNSDQAHQHFGSNFERVIRYRTQNQLPLIIASNNATLEEVFAGQHRRVVESLAAASMRVVPALGKDYRMKGIKS
jgi:DNA replication protein DnaC